MKKNDKQKDSQNESYLEFARLCVSDALEKIKTEPTHKNAALIIASATANLMLIIDNIDINSNGGEQTIEEIYGLCLQLITEGDI